MKRAESRSEAKTTNTERWPRCLLETVQSATRLAVVDGCCVDLLFQITMLKCILGILGTHLRTAAIARLLRGKTGNWSICLLIIYAILLCQSLFNKASLIALHKVPSQTSDLSREPDEGTLTRVISLPSRARTKILVHELQAKGAGRSRIHSCVGFLCRILFQLFVCCIAPPLPTKQE